MQTALGILGLAAAVLAVTAVADRIRFSAPLLLMLVGIGASYVPFIHEPELTPEVVLLGFLPPLLYAASIRTSLIDFRSNVRPILSLSVGLVVITALGVGLITWVLLPSIHFATAFALGAVVAPPDAVAATSIARRVGLPRRIVTILEGESLVNDATAITCLRVAIAAIGGAVSTLEVTGGFLTAALGGVAIGLAVAFVAVAVRKRVHQPVFDTAISLMVPFAAYLPAERLGPEDYHGSGVIAVVTAGLLLGHKSPVIQSGQSRLSERVNWATIQFLLENTVFLLIGLQARRIITAMSRSGFSPGRITVLCLAVLVGVIALRMVWVAIARTFLYRSPNDDEVDERPPWSHTLVIGWAGLRGVVTLATSFLIPVEVAERDILIFAAMVVTAGTLLLQGLTLPWLVHRLNIRGPDSRSDALQAATVMQTASNAALARLDEVTSPDDAPETVAMVRDRISSRPDALWEQLGNPDLETPAAQYRRLRMVTLQAERDEVLKIRGTGTVDQEVLADVLRSFDVEESMLSLAIERDDQLAEDEIVPTPTGPQGACEHLDEAPADIEPDGSGVCEDCVREGTRPVHLRICLVCGNVGCCDSSQGRHAERHYKKSHHPVMRSFEPGESWRWCYVDERMG